MKQICLIAGSTDDTLALTPLMKAIQKECTFILTLVSTAHHQNEEMDIIHRRIEEEGFLVDEETCVRLKSQWAPVAMNRLEYETVFKRLRPDMVVLFGNSYDALTAAIAASLHHIPITHIQGGESAYRDWDQSHGYGITKLSHLHLAATPDARNRILAFGEHPDRVFSVGSLLSEQLRTSCVKDDTSFFNRAGIPAGEPFILVSHEIDPAMGSKIADRFEPLLQALSHPVLTGCSFLFQNVEDKGLGKMVNQMISDFCMARPGQCRSFGEMSLTDLSAAVRNCSLIAGNSAAAFTIAPEFNTAAVNIGNRQQDRKKTENIIDCECDSDKIVAALKTGLSLEFSMQIQTMLADQRGPSTSKQIVQVLSSFQKEDIRPKAYFSKS